MKNYESETTTFLRDFLRQHPEVLEKQKEHRATWWDRPQDFKERDRLDQAEVPKRSYEYY